MDSRCHQPSSIPKLRTPTDRTPKPVYIHSPCARITLTRKPGHASAAVRPSSAAHFSCPGVASKTKGQHLKLPARNDQVQR